MAFTTGVVVVMSLILTCIYYFSSESDMESRLMAQARDAAEYLNASPSSENIATLEHQFAGVVRFTLVDAEGVVLYDSATENPGSLENHADRPEIVNAEASGEGSVTRYSSTLRTDTIYAAVQLDDGSVVRLAESRSSLLSFVSSLLGPIMLSLLISVLLVNWLSRKLTKRIMKPIDALDFSDPLENDIYEEMDPLLIRIDQQQHQLKEQNKELALAESMRRDFSANVSHEMKTPLQVISGYAELMKSGVVPPEDTMKFAGIIYDESQAMRSLINDVLTISRLDETTFDSAMATPIEVLSVADRMSNRLTSLADERGVQVIVSGERATILGSPTLFEEVIYNLIENGIRYNHRGGTVTLTVSNETNPKPLPTADRGVSPREASQLLSGQAKMSSGAIEAQHQVVICVRDTGQGIPQTEHDKIFERFYRMEKSRSKETGGTGLGLAIVKHGVQYHNGTITVYSEVGKGTTFVLRFVAAE